MANAVNPKPIDDDVVVADKFKWSDLYKKEDWWAIWLGFFVILCGVVSVQTGLFKFKAVKFTTWANESVPTFIDAITGEYLIQLAITFVFLAAIFAVGSYFMGRDVKAFLKGFCGVFFFAWLAYLLSAHATMKNYVEYAAWALLVGLLVCNTIGTPNWMKPAIQTEFYVKTGLVIMGAEVLFSNISNFGIYGLAIAWFVTPIVIIFMWLYGTKILKMASKPMVIVIATATSVCGVSAAIAAAAASGAKKNDLTFAIGLSLIFTVLMMIFMPIIVRVTGMDPLIGGAWIGGTVDSTGAVVLAGEALGPVGGQVAALVKMIQNILIGFIALAISIFFAMKVDVDNSREKVGVGEIWHRFPKFIIGFFLASVFFSFVIMPTCGATAYSAILKTFSNYKGWCFCLAFTSIGLESNFKEMIAQMEGGKPMNLYIVGQTFNLVLTLFIAWVMLSGIILPIPDIVTAK